MVKAGAINKSWQGPSDSHLKNLLCEECVAKFGDHSHK